VSQSLKIRFIIPFLTYALCRKLSKAELEELVEQARPCPEPVAARYPLPAHYKAITENLERLIEDYLEEGSSYSYLCIYNLYGPVRR
jgi:hypothetical protein